MTIERTILRSPALDNSSKLLFEKYVAGYVHRINNVTFKGDLKTIHLDFKATDISPQVDRKAGSLILPVFAFESMPKRLSELYVLHCLSILYFKEGSKEYWSSISKFVPNFESKKRQFEVCFERNVKEALFKCGEINVPTSIWARPRIPRILVGKADSKYSSEIASHCDQLIAQVESSEVPIESPSRSTFLNNSISSSETDIKSNTKSGAIPVSV